MNLVVVMMVVCRMIVIVILGGVTMTVTMVVRSLVSMVIMRMGHGNKPRGLTTKSFRNTYIGEENEWL
jgi:hypothetical protein